MVWKFCDLFNYSHIDGPLGCYISYKYGCVYFTHVICILYSSDKQMPQLMCVWYKILSIKLVGFVVFFLHPSSSIYL